MLGTEHLRYRAAMIKEVEGGRAEFNKSAQRVEWHLLVGKDRRSGELKRSQTQAWRDGAAIRLEVRHVPKFYWVRLDRLYVTADRDLAPEDVVALINEAENKRRLRLAKAHALQAMAEQLDTPGKRQAIPTEVKTQVWQRDKGQCVECGSNQNLEFDHIIPLALGGANTFRNLQLLCEMCNRRKGAALG